MQPIKILAIGPLPPPVGGTTVSFTMLIESLSDRPDVEIRTLPLPSGRESSLRNLGRWLRHLVDLVRGTAQSDVVSIHCNSSGIHVRIGVTSAVARLFGKPLIVRTFGGQPLRENARLSTSDQAIRALRRADLYLGQSKQQVQEAREQGIARAEWFPTHRRMPPAPGLDADRSCRSFVFLGHVKSNKGILEIIEAGERFEADVRIDVYGPFTEDLTEAVFEGCRRVRYLGIVEPDRVLDVLRQYDALLLPTYQPGEGYPGIIIEAYSVGLAVISTRWLCVPELVDEHSGVLVEPGNAEELHDAMQRLMHDREFFHHLRRGALDRRMEFDVDVWSDRFVQFCRETVENRRSNTDSSVRPASRQT